MGVLDGQEVSAAITNPAFINKNINDIMPNILGFSSPISGPGIADIQQAVNNIYTATGVSEFDSGTDYNATAGTINNGQNYQTALGILANKFDAATGHFHSGDPGDGPQLPVVWSIGVAPATAGNTGDYILTAGTGINLIPSLTGVTIEASGVAGVTSLAASGYAGLTGDVVLVGGTGTSITQSGQQITISVTGSSFTPIAPTMTVLKTTGTTTGYLFALSSSQTLVAGDTYTNNGNTYTVLNSGSTTSLYTSGAGAPQSSGTLTRTSGTGPTSMTFTSATAMATYTPPSSPAPLYLEVELVGAGGGGSGASNGNYNGSNGTDTIFGIGLLIGKGGTGPTSAVASPSGIGGQGIIDSSLSGVTFTGETGGQGMTTAGASGAVYGNGGVGGSSFFGGRAPDFLNNPQNAVSNTGSGGAGGFTNRLNPGSAGAGGGAGGYAKAIIPSPSTSYTYVVGLGGAGGPSLITNGGAGTNGADGIIIITEYYQ